MSFFVYVAFPSSSVHHCCFTVNALRANGFQTVQMWLLLQCKACSCHSITMLSLYIVLHFHHCACKPDAPDDTMGDTLACDKLGCCVEPVFCSDANM